MVYFTLLYLEHTLYLTLPIVLSILTSVCPLKVTRKNRCNLLYNALDFQPSHFRLLLTYSYVTKVRNINETKGHSDINTHPSLLAKLR